MDIKTILAPFIGATIGYSTNWLAIKMLFKPYTEKRFLGIKIPFTPGLIPKERERIASSIGEVIEDYLLTDTVIIDELSKASTKEHLLNFINKNLYNETGNIHLKELLGSEENRPLLNKLEGLLIDKMVELVQEDEIKALLIRALCKQICAGLQSIQINDIVSETSLEQKFQAMLKDEHLKAVIHRYVGEIMSPERTIKEMVNQQTLDGIKEVVFYHIEGMTNAVDEVFNNEKIREKVVALIDSTIKEKVGALGAMFVNAESVYQTIASKTKEKLEEDEVRVGIRQFISGKIDNMCDTPLEELLPEEARQQFIITIEDNMIHGVSQLDIYEVVGGLDKDIYTLINGVMDGILENKIYEVLNDKYDALLGNSQTRELMSHMVVQFLDKTISSEISISIDDKRQVNTFVLKKYEGFLERHVIDFIQEVKLGKIIETQLNSFNLHMLEDIILSIAKKELNAITWLGGVLGFIIGLISLIL